MSGRSLRKRAGFSRGGIAKVHSILLDLQGQSRIEQLVRFEHGQQQPVPAGTLKGISWDDIVVFCRRHGLYQLITTELVSFCRKVIGGRRAIEIGAGRGSLGAALNIPQTDSHLVQSRPEYRRFYRLLGEPVGPLPQTVAQLDAAAAVRKHKPDVVVACWATSLGQTSESTSPYGVDETALLDGVQTYLLVGNANVHRHKAIMLRPHRKLHQGKPWLISRASHPEHNAVWIWGPFGDAR